MSAEVLAFLKVAKYAENNEIKQFAILTDSLSGIQAINNQNHKNYLIDTFINKVNTFAADVHINEIFDTAAKNATLNGTILEIPWPLADAINQMSNTLWNEWSRGYQEIAQNGNSQIYKIFPSLSRTPWLKNCTFHSFPQKQINHAFSGHCFCNNTLAKMNVVPSNLCNDCGVDKLPTLSLNAVSIIPNGDVSKHYAISSLLKTS